ncbi:MAG: dethiobiotin synthase [Bdellovibrionales bacterium]|nr:dethiobiotin synthase [Bdellovibrionales bacterium]
MEKNPQGIFVTGTGTGVGKTLVSTGLCLHFQADYWKPIQTGTPTDTDFVRRFISGKKIHKSVYRFQAPLSPNQSAELENKSVELHYIQRPESSFLIVEGCGGIFVPLNKTQTQMDLIEQLGFPAIVTAQSGLGTLNHTLLTLEALASRNLPVLGLILSGPPHPKNVRDLEFWGKTPVLLELDLLPSITKKTLSQAFKSLQI